MAQTASTRQVQLTVPSADTTMNEWLDVQYSAADSIRKLIRESVAREGFIDVANRPVRPPAHPIYVAEDFPDEPAPRPVREQAAARAEPASAPKPAPTPSSAADAAAEDDVPEPHAAPRTPTTQALGSPAVDRSAADTIDDILGL